LILCQEFKLFILLIGNNNMSNKLADIKKDFAQWYQDVLAESEFIDQSPTKGCFVLRPYCYALWENMTKVLDQKIAQTGTQNAYFPLLIPESFLKKEAKHVEGFSPELAVVTYAGGEKLEEPLVVRPTSETIIYYMFARWIKSWRDLPLKVNQWANVVRWEMRTRPFLRTTEFLWQEGHTAHATHEQAIEMAEEILQLYKNFIEDYLAIPAVDGMKSDSEKFAGGERTYCIEGLMQDGKALQMCTSHVLLQSFAAAFDIKFQDEGGVLKVPYCSSWGATTRLIGALIMTHGDQRGLVMPPKIAPIKAVIIPIYKTEEEKQKVLDQAFKLKERLCKKDFIVNIDDRDQMSPGAKFYHWEIRGVPVRIEIGPKDIEKDQVVFVNRVEEGKGGKSFVSMQNVEVAFAELLEKIQKQLFENAKKRLQENWHQADDLSSFGAALENESGFYQVGWCGDPSCEAKLKDHKATIRCLLKQKDHKTCFSCGKSSKTDVLVAKSY
jgi:prolyl-tRNA synthetase